MGQGNDGLNIRANAGDPVRSAADGDVVYAGDQVPGFGNLVLVNTANAADNRTIAITDASQITISGNTLTINPSFDLQSSGAYSVQLAAGIDEVAGVGPLGRSGAPQEPPADAPLVGDGEWPIGCGQVVPQ